MNYNQYYDRNTTELKRKIKFGIIIGIILVVVGGGYLLFGDKLFNKVEKPLSTYAKEKVYTDNKGNVIERYSYIEIKEKKLNVMNLREWCVEYATPNIDKNDKFIIKYKGNGSDLGIIMNTENQITVDCKIVKSRDGRIRYQYQSDEYNIFFKDDKITKYTKDNRNNVKFYDWDFKKNDWSKAREVY